MESVYEGSEGKGLFNFEGNGGCFLSRLIGECMQANTGQGIKTYFLKVGSCDFFFFNLLLHLHLLHNDN